MSRYRKKCLRTGCRREARFSGICKTHEEEYNRLTIAFLMVDRRKSPAPKTQPIDGPGYSKEVAAAGELRALCTQWDALVRRRGAR